MINNVNVINNAGNNIDIKVNEADGAIQIVIDLPVTGTELSLLKPGDVFEKNNIQYIICEQFENGTTAIVRKDCLDKTMDFGNNNNWKESKCRKYLNDEYLNEIVNAFGVDNIVEHEVDLTSLDGYDDYGISLDKVSVMNIDRYRKYHKYIGDIGESNYLSTPLSTESQVSGDEVVFICGDGGVDYFDCGWPRLVRPFFIVKS